jgi:hypothetical protein
MVYATSVLEYRTMDKEKKTVIPRILNESIPEYTH